MILDLAYALRQLLAEQNLCDDHLLGFLLLGTRAASRSRDLQVGNTLACLHELACFSTVGEQYPGEPDCGIPAFGARVAPFAHTYLVHIGDDLTPREFDAQAAMLAEFLYASSVSSAAPGFEAARGPDTFQEYPRGQCRVRTCSLAHVGGDPETTAAAADYLCRLVVRRWCGLDSPQLLPKNELQALSAKFAAGLELKLDRLLQRVDELIGPQLLPDRDQYFAAIAEESCQACRTDQAVENPDALGSAVDGLLTGGTSIGVLPSGRRSNWYQAVQQRLERDATQHVDALLEWFAMLSRQPQVQLSGVRAALQWLLPHLSQLEQDLSRCADSCASQPAARTEREGSAPGPAFVQQRAWRQACRAVTAYVRTVYERLQEFELRLNGLLRRLDDFSTELGSDFADDEPRIAGPIAARRWPLAQELDLQLKKTVLDRPGAIFAWAHGGPQQWRQLAREMRESAGRLVSETLARQTISQLTSATSGPEHSEDQVTQWLRSVRPVLRECGGKERALMLVPGRNDAARTSLAALLQQTEFRNATMVPSHEERIAVAYDIGDVPLENVLVRISGGRRECIELAARLHTRKDVTWNDTAEPARRAPNGTTG
jgi:hypothetical protein